MSQTQVMYGHGCHGIVAASSSLIFNSTSCVDFIKRLLLLGSCALINHKMFQFILDPFSSSCTFNFSTGNIRINIYILNYVVNSF